MIDGVIPVKIANQHPWYIFGNGMNYLGTYGDQYTMETFIQLGDFEILQYTGLKDKNGKEIYEGDVVRGIELGYENTGWENELRTGAVVFSKSGSWVYTVGSQEHQLLCYMKNPEILGNIYEHPELLSSAG